VTITASSLLGDGYIDIPLDVYRIAQRIVEGDPTMGWRGDPQMSLMANPRATDGRHFEVWGVDAEGQPYIVAAYEKVSPKILADLAASDWQNDHRQMLTKMSADAHAAKRKRDDRRRDQEAEIADRLGHAVRRAFGHLGGGTRGFFGQVGGGGR
jgi:hypothetical protein